MLFSSVVFIFAFLPVALLVTYCGGHLSRTAAKITLLLISLGFYAYWRIQQLPILLFSIVVNYFIGRSIRINKEYGNDARASIYLAFGIIIDLSILGWFKYANFVANNINYVFGYHIHLNTIALPLAISFFTFQKLAFLVDSARGETRRISLVDFSLFAAFFPQLIAGPIVHFKEIIPQLQSRRFGHLITRNLLVGLVLFSIGLFKKTVIADTLSDYAGPLFRACETGHPMALVPAWLAAVSFTFQLYFDFSGYSDMAIGLGRMFGVKLPLNFHSPLRAGNIIEYWRRWHMTLQRFIVAYIFQPLSLPLNRLAAARRLQGWTAFAVSSGVPILVTFIAVGIWHGAGWTFVLFGLMHAIYICLNEVWREWTKQRRRQRKRGGLAAREPGTVQAVAGHVATLLAVIFANVLFKSSSVAAAKGMWSGMIGLHGATQTGFSGVGWGVAATLVTSVVMVFLMPNSQQIMGRFDPAFNWREWRDVAPAPLTWTWKPDLAGWMFAGATLFFGVIFIQRGQAVFLYFNF